jgi:hypothetical protein
MSILSFQGIANRIVEDFIERHGNVTWSDIEQSLAAAPEYAKLGGYWRFHQKRATPPELRNAAKEFDRRPARRRVTLFDCPQRQSAVETRASTCVRGCAGKKCTGLSGYPPISACTPNPVRLHAIRTNTIGSMLVGIGTPPSVQRKTPIRPAPTPRR